MADNNDPLNGEQDEDKPRKNQMDFIVEQQVRLDANFESITERLDRLTQNVDVFVMETRKAINKSNHRQRRHSGTGSGGRPTGRADEPPRQRLGKEIVAPQAATRQTS